MRGRCGLLSELNGLLGFYEGEIWGTDNKLYVDTTKNPYFKDLSLDEIFTLNDHFVLNEFEQGINMYAKESYWQCATTFYTFNMPSEIGSKIFQPAGHAAEYIKHVIEKLNLPEKYCCAQVRRGDKAEEQIPGKRWDVQKYIDSLCRMSPGEDNLNIFVMSDEFSTILDMKEHIQEKKLPHKLFYICDEKMTGYDCTKHCSGEFEYTHNQTFDFLAEIEIAKNATCLAGTLSSNVYRYIRDTTISKMKFESLEYLPKNKPPWTLTPGVF